MMQAVINFIFSAIQAATVFGIIESVLRSRFHKYQKFFAFIVAVFLSALGINIIGDSYTQGLIWLTIVCGICHFLYTGPIEVKIFYLFFAQYICVVSEMILSTIMISLPQEIIKNIMSSMFMITAISVSIKLFIIVAGVLFVYYIHRIHPNLPRKYWVILDGFLLIVIEGAQILFHINMQMQNTEYFIYMQISLYALLILGIFVIFFLGKICWAYEKHTEYELWQLRGQEFQKIILYQKEVNEEIKKIRHDMKKHLSTIGYMIETNQEKEAKQYISNLTEVINATKPLWFCGNYIVDTILNKYMAVCKNKQIKLDLSADKIPDLPMNPIDISAILDNLLDNAIEAVEKLKSGQRYIRIKVFLYKENFTIVIKNPYMGQINVEKGKLQTTKSRKKEHGYGMKSIKSAVKKNHGIFKYYVEVSEFTALVMLPIHYIE